MHNLHLVVVEMPDGQEACDFVEGQIESFGDENNWRTICGAVRYNGQVHQTKEGRWEPETLESLKKSITDAMFNTNSEDDFFGKCFNEALAKLNAKEKMTSMDWYYIQKYAEEMGDRASATQRHEQPDLTPESFDLFRDEYRSWKLDEFGLTSLLRHGEEVNKENLWVVLVDMHS